MVLTLIAVHAQHVEMFAAHGFIFLTAFCFAILHWSIKLSSILSARKRLWYQAERFKRHWRIRVGVGREISQTYIRETSLPWTKMMSHNFKKVEEQILSCLLTTSSLEWYKCFENIVRIEPMWKADYEWSWQSGDKRRQNGPQKDSHQHWKIT